MNLRKALDKAKNERALSAQIAPEVIDKSKTGGEPLTYKTSKKCVLDQKVTESNRGVCLYPDQAEIERYKILRTRIHQRFSDKPMNTIMVTSANKGEGKSTTSINMAFTFARDLNHTVCLVDCDFTGQDVHRYLGIKSKLSLIDYFLDDVPLSDLIIWPGIEKMTLISGDRTVFDSSELLSSDAMAGLVKEMGSRYKDRYVFFDAPPLLERSEALYIAPLMDGILMVVKAGVTSKKDVQKAVELIPKDKFLGFVLNKQGS